MIFPYGWEPVPIQRILIGFKAVLEFFFCFWLLLKICKLGIIAIAIGWCDNIYLSVTYTLYSLQTHTHSLTHTHTLTHTHRIVYLHEKAFFPTTEKCLNRCIFRNLDVFTIQTILYIWRYIYLSPTFRLNDCQTANQS